MENIHSWKQNVYYLYLTVRIEKTFFFDISSTDTKEDFELSLFQLGCQFLPLFPFLNGTLRIHFAESNSDVFSQIVSSTE